jgi:hypothetical protein
MEIKINTADNSSITIKTFNGMASNFITSKGFKDSFIGDNTPYIIPYYGRLKDRLSKKAL